MNPPPESERAAGMAGVREEMQWRAELLETFVAKLRADIPIMGHTFDAAIRQLRITMAVAGEVGLDNSMSSEAWRAAMARTTETINSDCDELSNLRDRIAGIGRFTTRINRAKKAAVAEIDRLIRLYREQGETFTQVTSAGTRGASPH
jgi:hypothetical protein